MNLGVHFNISCRADIAPDRAGRSCAIRSDFGFVAQQFLRSVAVAEYHDHVRGRSADLRSKGSTSDCQRDRAAPTVLCATHCHIFSVYAEDPITDTRRAPFICLKI
jgi:hypothetical protein